MDMRVAVKEGFLSSASFVSREQPPPSPIKHVGMEAFGRVCCVSVCIQVFGIFFFFGFAGFCGSWLEIGFTRLCYAPPKFWFDRFVTLLVLSPLDFSELRAKSKRGITKESGEKVRSKNTPLQLCLARSEYPHET